MTKFSITDAPATHGLYTVNIDGNNVYSSERVSKVLARIVDTIREDHKGYPKEYVDGLVAHVQEHREVEYYVNEEGVYSPVSIGVGFIFT